MIDCKMKPRLVMQFHITGRCNLRCKHCYREEGDVEPLSTQDVFRVIHQYEELLQEFNRENDSRRRGHINITGGEPFLRKDIRELLVYFGQNRKRFSYGVLSNGSVITDELMDLLKETGAAFVQLSIDGRREVHDALRAPGDYDRTFAMAKRLEEHGIPTYISFTANKENYHDLPQVARQCRKLGITRLWSDRLVPIGHGAELLTIDKSITMDYLRTLKKARGNWLIRKLYPHTEVRMNRALQFQCGGECYQCGAAKTLVTVDEMGRIMPCRRMPIVCGNVFDDTLKSVYYQHKVFLELRYTDPPSECSCCDHYWACRGGAKCQSYAVYGSFTRADPGCTLKMKNGIFDFL
ncbi:MAG: radical SAM protein [Clostridia bacterium]|nr:radical SAM protein [Clostridia bacterium]